MSGLSLKINTKIKRLPAGKDWFGSRKIRLIEEKAKHRHIKKLACKGMLKVIFFGLIIAHFANACKTPRKTQKSII